MEKNENFVDFVKLSEKMNLEKRFELVSQSALVFVVVSSICIFAMLSYIFNGSVLLDQIGISMLVSAFIVIFLVVLFIATDCATTTTSSGFFFSLDYTEEAKRKAKIYNIDDIDEFKKNIDIVADEISLRGNALLQETNKILNYFYETDDSFELEQFEVQILKKLCK
jgi:hypothetical protein